MPKYEVYQKTTVIDVYEVEADNPEEAEQMVADDPYRYEHIGSLFEGVQEGSEEAIEVKDNRTGIISLGKTANKLRKDSNGNKEKREFS